MIKSIPYTVTISLESKKEIKLCDLNKKKEENIDMSCFQLLNLIIKEGFKQTDLK